MQQFKDITMTDLAAQGFVSNSSRVVSEIKTILDDYRDFMKEAIGGSARSELTIATGSITPPDGSGGSIFRVDTEADTVSDDLDTIAQANTHDGQLLILFAEHTARTVVVTNAAGGTGQVLTVDDNDFSLDDADKWIMVQRSGTSWIEILRHIPQGSLSTITGANLAAADTVRVYDDDANIEKSVTIPEARIGFSPANQCVFRASRSTAQPSIANSTWTKIKFNTENLDVGGNYNATTNYEFTAPVAGVYEFAATVNIAGLNNGKWVFIRFVASTAGSFTGSQDVAGANAKSRKGARIYYPATSRERNRAC